MNVSNIKIIWNNSCSNYFDIIDNINLILIYKIKTKHNFNGVCSTELQREELSDLEEMLSSLTCPFVLLLKDCKVVKESDAKVNN